MNIENKIKELYKEYDFLVDNDRWVQVRSVVREIKKLEQSLQTKHEVK